MTLRLYTDVETGTTDNREGLKINPDAGKQTI